MNYLPYDIQNGTHRTAQEEWMPHEPSAPEFTEWHYFTAPMTGENGHTYFLFLCSFNFSAEKNRAEFPVPTPAHSDVYLTLAHLSDYSDGLFLNDAFPALPRHGTAFDPEQNALVLRSMMPLPRKDVFFQYRGDRVLLRSQNGAFSCELACSGADRVMWMQDHLQKEGFIQEGTETERSFYYSLPELPFTGWIEYTGKDGKPHRENVSGYGWIDRQWGDFTTKSWEWTSFRFDDGDRVNTYHFGNGYKVITYQKPDGTTQSFDSFKVVPTGYAMTPQNKITYSFGWEYELPVKDHYYRLCPLSDQDTQESVGNNFFEGLSRILDRSGRQVGWAVTESMDIRVMHNGPDDPKETIRRPLPGGEAGGAL
ncbi:MAG: lipocalin-like domain-containing protein [Clostridia bacterium]|nr:lipocalin-like domain-containing protein [Clostridia bacterium]